MNKISEIDSMDEIQKLSVYMDYYIKNRLIELELNCKFNLQEFDEFISPNNIEIKNHGPKWKENGFAQEVQIQLNGIYDYYWKFKDEIKLI